MTPGLALKTGSRSKHALFGSLGFVAKDVVNQRRVGSDALQEHEVRAERFLWSVGVLDVSLARLACFALCRPEHVLALDIVRGQRTHICRVLPLPRFFGGLGSASIGLEHIE